MNQQEKTAVLDSLEIELLSDGYVDLSFSLEQFETLPPDRRWQEIASCLRETDLPAKYEIFQEEMPRWEEASRAL